MDSKNGNVRGEQESQTTEDSESLDEDELEKANRSKLIIVKNK